MSSCTIEPFCLGVEGVGSDPYPSVQNRFTSCLWTWTAPEPRLKGTTPIAEVRKGAKLPKGCDQAAQNPWKSCAGGAGAEHRGSSASWEAPICLRDAAPRAPAPALPCSPQVITRQHRSFTPAWSSLTPRDASVTAAAAGRERRSFWRRPGGRWP